MKKLTLAQRIKEFYENRFRSSLPRRTNTLIRIDGKKFSSYTKGMKEPFDYDFVEDMNETAKFLCESLQGAKIAYVQSDEISILLTDYDSLETDALYDGNINKITSITASMATAKFNELRWKRELLHELYFNHNAGSDENPNVIIRETDFDKYVFSKMAMFDSRVFVIPEKEEVVNYFLFRQQDCTKNSISAAARAYFSHKEVNKLNGNQKQDKLFKEKGINWNDYPVGVKRGRMIIRKSREDFPERKEWVIDDNIPIISQDRDYIFKRMP